MPEIKILTAQRAVTAAGTAEKIKETPEPFQSKVISVTVRANTGNAGNIYVRNGDDVSSCSTTSYILSAGEVLTLDVHDIYDAYLNLSKIWIDADTSGDGISYVAFEVI